MQTLSRVTSADSISVDSVVRSRLRVWLHSLCRSEQLNVHAMRSACEVFFRFCDENCICQDSQGCVLNWEDMFYFASAITSASTLELCNQTINSVGCDRSFGFMYSPCWGSFFYWYFLREVIYVFVIIATFQSCIDGTQCTNSMIFVKATCKFKCFKTVVRP